MKSIIAFSIAFVVLIGASIGFYMWYFEDDSNTYVYDYKKSSSYQSYTPPSTQYNQERNNISDNTYYPSQQINPESLKEETPVQNNPTIDENTSTQEVAPTTQTNIAEVSKNETITPKVAQEEQKVLVENNKQTSIKKEKTTKYKNTMQEYITKGKTSRYEPRLSNDFVKVYVLDGKSLSDYRVDMLKEMINPVKINSQDYNLTIFIDMLSNDNMKLSIYNKDIVFAKNKKKYNYVDVKISDLKFLFERNGYSEYSNENLLEKINQNLAREDILKRVKIQGYADDRGSTFANYMIGLNRAMNVAKHFFSFTEVIEIESLGKDTYPTKDKSDSQRQNNRKVEISFYN
ncbi:OmpA family protein [Campylobacter lari]|nr:OmpA family protein [Campylobacter lari]